MPPDLLVALPSRCLLCEAHTAQKRVLPKLALHGKHRLLQALLLGFRLFVGEQIDRRELLGNNAPEAHVDATDRLVAARRFLEEIDETRHDLRIEVRAPELLAGSAGMGNAASAVQRALSVASIEKLPIAAILPIFPLSRIAHVKRYRFRHQVLLNEIEYKSIDHFLQHHERIVVAVIARQHLSAHHGMGARLVFVDFGNGARLDAMRMVDEVFGVHSELPIQRIFFHAAHAAKIVNAELRKALGDAGSDVPDIGYRGMRLYRALEFRLIEVPDVVLDVLCGDVE